MSTIADKSTFVNFRERCEDKNTLNQKGTMYVGTGKTTDALGDGTKVSVTVATPQPEENALLVKDDSMEGRGKLEICCRSVRRRKCGWARYVC